MPPYEKTKDSFSPLKMTKKHIGLSISRKSSTDHVPEEEPDKPEAEEDLSVEITAFINSLKNHKAPGKDRLLNQGIIIKIPKKGTLPEYSNWRGITLLSTPSKTLCESHHEAPIIGCGS